MRSESSVENNSYHADEIVNKSLYIAIPTWRKFTYGGIELGNQFAWTMISSFLMIYLTDVFLIPIGMVSILFLVCKFWDAINDPLVGMLADRTRTRWGRYRPWVMVFSAPMFVISCLLFYPHPEWPLPSKLIYVYVLYFLLVALYTCVNLNGSSLNSVMTQDPAERGSLASFRVMFAFLGGTVVLIIVSYFEPQLSATYHNLGYFIIACACAIIGIPLQIIGAATQKEIVPPSEKRVIPLKTLLRYCFKNQEFVKLSIIFFFVGFSWYGMLSIEYYWFIYVVKDGQFYGLVNLICLVPTIIGSILAPTFAAKLKSKGKAAMICFLISAAINLASYALFNITMTHFLIIVSIFGITFFACFGQSLLYGMIPDTVEYSELLSDGLRMDGFMNTLISFWNKVGITIGTAASGWILEAAGYLPGVANQPETVIKAMNLFRWMMPFAASLLVAFFCYLYKIDFKKFDEIVGKLQKKRKENIKISEE